MNKKGLGTNRSEAFGLQISVYLWECPELPDGADIDGADIAGAAIRGSERAASEARERATPPLADIVSDPPTGIVATCSVTIPCDCTFCDSLAMLSNCPRGIPNPAELFRMTILPPDIAASDDVGPRFTMTVPVPLVGACGATKPAGALSTTGCP